jgi:hypothetical protein
MKASLWTVAARTILVLAAAGAAFATSAMAMGPAGAGMGAGPKVAAPTPITFSGEYAEIIREANMTAAQQKSLETVVRDEEKALAQHDRQNAKNLDDLNKKLAEVNKKISDLRAQAPDPNAMAPALKTQIDAQLKNAKVYQDQIDRLAASREGISRTYKGRAVSLLTPVQKTAWFTFVLNRRMTEEFLSVGLSAEQQGKVRAWCEQAAKSVKGQDPLSSKDTLDALITQIATQVLDATQRANYVQARREKEKAKAAGATL